MMPKRSRGKKSGRPNRNRGRRPWWPFAVGAAVLVLIALAVIRPGGGSGALADKALSSPVSSIGNFAQVAKPKLTSDGKVPIFFLSALYCPYCAAERWALALALGRFGTWTNLGPAHSTSGVDGFSQVPTYDFLKAHYGSRYVAFVHRDVADANGKPLQSLTPSEQSIVNSFDRGGGIPFLLIDGAYAQQGSGYSPGLLVNKQFAQVQADLKINAPDGRAIQHEADVLTALICHADRGRPSGVCNAPSVHALEAQVQ